MSFRPVPARWFELVTTSAHIAPALQVLAQTGAVELEVRSGEGGPLLLPDMADLLRGFRDAARRFGNYWPHARTSGGPGGDPRKLLEAADGHIVAWQIDAKPVIDELEDDLRADTELHAFSEALSALGDDFPAPDRLASAGPRLAVRLYRLPVDTPAVEPTTALALRRWVNDKGRYLLAVGPQADIEALSRQVQAFKGQVIAVPAGLPATAVEARHEVDSRMAVLSREIAGHSDLLDRIARKHRLAEAIGDFRLIEWLGEHAGEISGGARLAHVTGWSAELDGGDLAAALARRGVPGLVRLMPEPEGVEAPLVLKNPPWARAFEVFARMMGMPGRTEADPSMILAIVAPLLFGFMFGDVGQGLTLMAAGAWFGRRMPVLRLLVPGGAVAAVFGVLFGSVFCVESLIPALWLRPMHEPVTLLTVTLAAGVAILLLGLTIDAVQSVWRGAARNWWSHKAGLVFAYISLLAGLIWQPAIWGAVIGAGWFVMGAAIGERRLSAAGAALAELVEQLVQLLVNTVSFARVGAFALAHAGLAAAVVGVADVVGGLGYWVVLLFGNALVLTLEGLVVGIQTTRLVLFEFFIRFLAGGGRVFKPLVPPPGVRFFTATKTERLFS